LEGCISRWPRMSREIIGSPLKLPRDSKPSRFYLPLLSVRLHTHARTSIHSVRYSAWLPCIVSTHTHARVFIENLAGPNTTSGQRVSTHTHARVFIEGSIEPFLSLPQNTPQLHLFSDLVATAFAFWYYVFCRKSNVFELFKTWEKYFPKAEVASSNLAGGTSVLAMFFQVGRV
jgi:hypothetical protein